VKKVDFFVVGAMKAATTALAMTLNEVEEVSTGRKKEFNFFTEKKNPTSLERYHENFDPECRIWGEVAPKYGKRQRFHGVAQRIYNYNPEAKILFIRRDPIARALSELKMYYEEGEITHQSKIHWFKNRRSRRWKHQNASQFSYYSFGDFDSNPIVQASRYDFQLQPYRELFPNSLLILDFENLTGHDSSSYLAKIQEFIGVITPLDFKMKKAHSSKTNLIPSELSLSLSEKSKYLQTKHLLHRMPFLRKIFLSLGYLRIQKNTWFSPSLEADLQRFFDKAENQ